MAYTIPNQFSTQSGNVPASQLDADFSALLTGVNNAFLSGLLSARPAAGSNGAYYFATDVNGGTLYKDTGTSWVPVAPGVGVVSFGLDSTRNLVVKPSDFSSQGGWVNSTTTFTAQAFPTLYALFDGTAADGFVLSSSSQFFAFNVLISAAASPTTVVYEYWNGSAWTAFVPTVAATWTALGLTQARWTSGLVAGWTTGGSGTNIPAGNFNIRVRQTVGTTTVSGRCSMAEAVDITIDEVVMSDGSGNKFRYTSVSVTVNITRSLVANGRDQGGAFTASTYVYLWGEGGASLAFSGLWSASSTAPTLQGSCTAKILLGAYRVDANVLLLPWSQSGKRVVYRTPIKDLTGGNSATAGSLAVTIPPLAVIWWGYPFNASVATITQLNDAPYVYSSTVAAVQYSFDQAGTSQPGSPAAIRLTFPQTIYWANSPSATIDIYTNGYEMPGNLN